MYSTDDEAIEGLRKWWSENGAWILGGLVLGAIILFGWRYWVEWREQTLADASERYEELLAASAGGEYERAKALADDIRGLRLSTPYADLAAFAVSRTALAAGDAAAARRALSEVVENSRDRDTVHLARLRLARLHLAAGEFDEATAVVTVREPGRYAPLYAELRGDLALARGDREAAIAAYREALAGPDQGIADRALLEMKLDDLGASAPSQGA